MQSALAVLQRYKCTQKSTRQWIEDTDTVLQQTSQKLDLENLTEYIQATERVIVKEETLKVAVLGTEDLFPEMETFFDSVVIKELKKDLETTCQRHAKLMEQLRCHQETLNR